MLLCFQSGSLSAGLSREGMRGPGRSPNGDGDRGQLVEKIEQGCDSSSLYIEALSVSASLLSGHARQRMRPEPPSFCRAGVSHHEPAGSSSSSFSSSSSIIQEDPRTSTRRKTRTISASRGSLGSIRELAELVEFSPGVPPGVPATSSGETPPEPAGETPALRRRGADGPVCKKNASRCGTPAICIKDY